MKSLSIEIDVADYDLDTIGFHFHVLKADRGGPKSSGFLRMTPSELEVFILALKASPAAISLSVPEGGIKPQAPQQEPADSPSHAGAGYRADSRYEESPGSKGGDFLFSDPAMPEPVPAAPYHGRPGDEPATHRNVAEEASRRDNRRSWNPDQRASGAFPDRLGKLSDNWSQSRSRAAPHPAAGTDSKLTA